MGVHEVTTPRSNSFANVSYEECVRRLGWESIGRLGVVEPNGAVSIYPVNYRFEHGAIIFRTTPRRAEILTGVPVTFEIDRVDDLHCIGWSVVARGRVSVLDESPLGATPVSWAPDGRTVTASLVPTEITGREIFSPTASHARP